MKYGDIFWTTKLGFPYSFLWLIPIICRFRIDPIPSSGRKRYRFKNFYRRMRTFQERKWSFSYPEYVRKRRNARNLPNNWEDIPRADIYYNKSWKKQKKKRQWM